MTVPLPRNLVISIALCLTLTACDQKNDGTKQSSDNRSAVSNSDSDTKTGEIAEAARQDAIVELSDKTFEDVRGASDCTDDCSGHNAGFAWAKDHQIFDPDQCGGNSDSFIEGCKAYGQEIESRTDAAEQGGSPSN